MLEIVFDDYRTEECICYVTLNMCGSDYLIYNVKHMRKCIHTEFTMSSSTAARLTLITTWTLNFKSLVQWNKYVILIFQIL